ncbi:WAT1-related protein [Drosera capensis]
MSTLLKVIGTKVSNYGAFIVTFYERMPINLHSPSQSHRRLQASSSASDWVIGGGFLALSYLLIALLSILKGSYPAKVSSLTWVMRDYPSGLLAIMPVGVVNTVQCWAFHKRGPVYVAMFKPLQMIIAAALGVVFLADTPSWKGKAKEIGKDDNCGIFYSEPSPDQVPLLANKRIDP